MHSYQRINNIAGWFVFAIAAFVYIATLEPTASFWDCGEFIAVSNKLMIPHPPGAPFFLLLGRVFSMFAEPDRVAYWVNMVSAMSSAFTILFLYFSITLLARKILKIEKGQKLELGQMIAIIGSGIIGALAYTFTDSFWFSAVEAEVYALSAFFTAIVFWAMLKWDAVADEPGSNRWLVFIAYMVGLSIGVHLLNLVTIPALGFIYYYRKYKPTPQKGFITFAISSVVLLVILVVIIPGLPKIAGWFEIKFVNGLGMPFNSGIIFFGLLLIGGVVCGIIYAIKKQKALLNTALLSFAFIFIGYSSYTITLIRSNYDPTIDENNPEDVMKFVSYLEREQYGDRPLFSGPQFNIGHIDFDKTKLKYKKGEDKYIAYDRKVDLVYPDGKTTLIPRMHSKRADHVEWYLKYLGWKKEKYENGGYSKKKIGMGTNLSFMINRQIGFYYWRYFGWNFVGRESDEQDYGVLGPFESKTEIPELMESKARNQYYALPLILGLIGLFFVFNRHSKMGWVITMLFFFTGIAIILYLNAPPHEPRERDYAYAGSYYAYCIFIGLAVLSIFRIL